MRTVNHEKRINQLDMEFAEKATMSIVQMLNIMGVKESEPFVFDDRRSGHGLADEISSIHYISLPDDNNDNTYTVLYNMDRSRLCFAYKAGEINCIIQSRLRHLFRRYVREHTEVSKKYLRTISDMAHEYYMAVLSEEQEAERDIIRMMMEMGLKPGEKLKLPDISRPRRAVDDVYEVYYNRGANFSGVAIDLNGEDYSVGYMYYTHDRFVANYNELCGGDFGAALCNRVAKEWSKSKKEKNG